MKRYICSTDGCGSYATICDASRKPWTPTWCREHAPPMDRTASDIDVLSRAATTPMPTTEADV